MQLYSIWHLIGRGNLYKKWLPLPLSRTGVSSSAHRGLLSTSIFQDLLSRWLWNTQWRIALFPAPPFWIQSFTMISLYETNEQYAEMFDHIATKMPQLRFLHLDNLYERTLHTDGDDEE